MDEETILGWLRFFEPHEVFVMSLSGNKMICDELSQPTRN